MKYLLFCKHTKRYILCDFKEQVSSLYQNSLQEAKDAPLVSMEGYWSVARMLTDNDLYTYLSKRYEICEIYTDSSVPYEWW